MSEPASAAPYGGPPHPLASELHPMKMLRANPPDAPPRSFPADYRITVMASTLWSVASTHAGSTEHRLILECLGLFCLSDGYGTVSVPVGIAIFAAMKLRWTQVSFFASLYLLWNLLTESEIREPSGRCAAAIVLLVFSGIVTSTPELISIASFIFVHGSFPASRSVWTAPLQIAILAACMRK